MKNPETSSGDTAKKTLFEIHDDVPADHYDKGISGNILQRYWHRRRFKEVLNIIDIKKGPLLDIGCHAALFTEKIISKTGSTSLYGIDISSAAIKMAKKRLPSGNFQVADAHNLPFDNNFFETVLCLEVLEHVDSPIRVLHEIKRVLRVGGYGIVLVPMDTGLFKIIWFLWTMYYPVWRHAHVQKFLPDTLEKQLKALRLQVIKTKTFQWAMLQIIVFKKV